MISIKWEGREIQNPIVRIVGIFLIPLLVLVTTPLTLQLSWLLRRFGRKGFVISVKENYIHYELSFDAFQKVKR